VEQDPYDKPVQSLLEDVATKENGTIDKTLKQARLF
jgi:hypothetical protein